MKVSLTNKPTLGAAFLITAFCLNCSGELAIYESNPESLYQGSLHYSTSEYNCKNCHGISWDGNGPQAKELTDRGIPIPDFTAVQPPQKTPLDYFKVITAGNEKTASLPAGHAYQSHTDKARWAMANFLFSLSAPIPETDLAAKEQRTQALAESQNTAREVYSRQRRWDMGYKPVAEREKAPAVKQMNVQFQANTQAAIVTDQNIQNQQAAARANIDGYRLYQNNCASCHGTYGEGGRNVRMGLKPGTIEKAVAGIVRQDPVFLSTAPLAKQSAETLKEPHGNGSLSTAIQPGYGFSEGQLSALSNYINAITER